MSDNTKILTDMPENAALDTQNEDATEQKMFTQQELEKIISERLERERKQGEAVLPLKRLLRSASEMGIIEGVSIADMAKSFEDKFLSVVETDSAAESGQQHENDVEEIPFPLIAEGGDENVTDNSQDAGKDDFFSVLSSIKQKHKGQSLDMLLQGDLFERYARGRSGNARDIFDDFCEFMASALPKDDGVDKSEEHADESFLNSTAFSSHSQTASGAGLTKAQMEIAKSAGMTYREYASLLESIPKNKSKN